ncbi:MAG TPA: hypothetical protein VHH36_01820 [Candidatus Thermoplasmatota archaeon]|nr:hypothetical protein [Candidatus Thermoplasmatota archaeon]
MAKGYPEPRQPEPTVGPLVAPGTCVICKRRPASNAHGHCEACAEALAR